MVYDVFISFKNSDENGCQTIDSEIAKKLYDFLTKKGLRVFFSNIELEFTGKAQYSRVINEALDSSRFLIAVGSSHKNLNSEWVYYEWDSFLNDIRSGIKPNAEVFVLFSCMKVSELPRALRQQQAFNADEKDSYEKLYRFIKNALGINDSKNAKSKETTFANNRINQNTEDNFLHPFEQIQVVKGLLNLDYPPNLAPSAQDSCDEYIEKCLKSIFDSEIKTIEKNAKDSMVRSFARQELLKREKLK